MESPQQFYATDGPMTAPGTQASQFTGTPGELGALCDLAQGVLIHVDIAPWLYEVKFSEERQSDRHVRSLTEMLARIHALDGNPLTVTRKPADRLAGCCRHFSVMLSGLLRAKGVPARARVGFGAYFNQGKFEDHWVAEYWNSAESRWVLVDAQMDAIQRKTFQLDFDPLDVPRNRFIIAGDAWQMCRSGRADPAAFGLSMVPHLHGLWFIAGNVVRDLASLNKAELLPWDAWGLMPPSDAEFSEETKGVIDKIAALTLAGDEAFPEIRALYQDDRLRVPPQVFNVLRNVLEPVA